MLLFAHFGAMFITVSGFCHSTVSHGTFACAGRRAIVFENACVNIPKHSRKQQIICSASIDSLPTLGLSEAASWHRARRKAILEKYPQVQALEGREPHGAVILLFSNALQFYLMYVASSLSLPLILLLGCTVGATLSLWQLTTLHEVIHGTCVRAGSRLQSMLMWLGSFPCVFGYFLYLQVGHLSHHNRMGAHSVADIFNSPAPYFEDGDVLHATHRMRLAGPTGPKPPPALARLFPDGRPASVALSFFDGGWVPGRPGRNMLLYAASLCLERLVLVLSDRVASVTGRVDFFAAKPAAGFHAVAVGHARLQTAFQAAVVLALGWRALLYLFVAETAWALPVHPACAMYITNHGSTDLPPVPPAPLARTARAWTPAPRRGTVGVGRVAPVRQRPGGGGDLRASAAFCGARSERRRRR